MTVQKQNFNFICIDFVFVKLMVTELWMQGNCDEIGKAQLR